MSEHHSEQPSDHPSEQSGEQPSEQPSVEELATAVAADPHRRSLRLALASALLNSGNATEAMTHIRFVLDGHPSDIEALGIGAMASALSGDQMASDAYAGALRMAQLRPGIMSTEVPAQRKGASITIPLISFIDVDGATEEKRRLEHLVVQPFRFRKQQPESIPTGTILFGPPSAGKAQLATALAGELHLSLVSIDLATICDPWGMPAAGAITEAFNLAEEQGPSLLFMNHLEAVTHRRLRYVPGGRDRLAELEAAIDRHDPSKVLLIAASAAPWMINAALRTKGRLDQLVMVGAPDVESRLAAMERALRARALQTAADLRAIARTAEGLSNEDCRTLIAHAATFALAESVDRNAVVALRDEHFRRALSETPRSAKTWFDMAYNFPEFMDDSTAFDPLFDYIRRHVRR
jgi:transitional endoplasmic reticulum ATPase